MRRILVLAVIAMTITACMDSPDPVEPPNSPEDAGFTATKTLQDGPYRLWAEGSLFFSKDHNTVEVVPARQSRFHLNTLKFLEEYCADCLKITNINSNGDGTIDLTVQITHPFPDNPEFSGFDVKGIIMFKGSFELPWNHSKIYPFYENVRMSWRNVGDPEVLNQDGYTARWSPYWDSGSDLPIFNYWEGKYTRGVPTANINAHLNFYTDEERHLFRADGKVSRTYHIYLPTGPVTAGYAIEACWEPPIKMPVTDPILDFPYSANQPEPYEFRIVLNNDEPITFSPCCNVWIYECKEAWVTTKKWYGDRINYLKFRLPDESSSQHTPYPELCADSPPDEERLYMYVGVTGRPDGIYRGFAAGYHLIGLDPYNIAYDIFDFELDLE